MFITINKDGSVYIQSSSFMASYDEQGKLNYSFGDTNAPKFIQINDNREKQSRGFTAESFSVSNGHVFINEAFINKTAIQSEIKYTVSGLHSDEYKEDLNQAVRQAIAPVIRQHIKVERVKEKQPENVFRGGVRVDKEEPATAKLDKAEIKAIYAVKYIEELSATFAKSDEAFAEALTKTISLDTPVTNKDFEEFKKQIASEFKQLQSSIITTQEAMANSGRAIAEHIRQLSIEALRKSSGF